MAWGTSPLRWPMIYHALHHPSILFNIFSIGVCPLFLGERRGEERGRRWKIEDGRSKMAGRRRGRRVGHAAYRIGSKIEAAVGLATAAGGCRSRWPTPPTRPAEVNAKSPLASFTKLLVQYQLFFDLPAPSSHLPSSLFALPCSISHLRFSIFHCISYQLTGHESGDGSAGLRVRLDGGHFPRAVPGGRRSGS
jgi:hypothetical protein